MPHSLGSKLACEFIGTMFLLIAAISPIILFYHVMKTEIAIAVLADALAVAFVLAMLIYVFGPISGAHLNPAVTVAMCLDRKCEVEVVGSYIIAQVAGGFVGVVASHLMFYQSEGTGGLIVISTVARPEGCYIAEFIGTFILVFSILMLVRRGSTYIPIMVGLLVGGMLMSTSSTMFANPAVTIARMFTYSAAGVRPFDGAIFIIVEFIAAVVAVAACRAIYPPGKDGKDAKK
jgi:glycerol uptake facilitator-like aquaporin